MAAIIITLACFWLATCIANTYERWPGRTIARD